MADAKSKELEIVQEKVRQITEKVDALQKQLDEAVAKKNAVVAEAEGLQNKLDLANRLVNGLADENTRWQDNVATFKNERLTTIGDALVSSAFVSYIGPFNYIFRNELW